MGHRLLEMAGVMEEDLGWVVGAKHRVIQEALNLAEVVDLQVAAPLVAPLLGVSLEPLARHQVGEVVRQVEAAAARLLRVLILVMEGEVEFL